MNFCQSIGEHLSGMKLARFEFCSKDSGQHCPLSSPLCLVPTLIIITPLSSAIFDREPRALRMVLSIYRKSILTMRANLHSIC